MSPSTSASSRLPRLHVVTDDDVLAASDFPGVARTLLAVGSEQIALHVRGPRTGGGRLLAVASELREGAAHSGAWLVVNDRADVALIAGLRAVHLGRRSLPVSEVRRILGRQARLGVSTHTPQESAQGALDGADWIFAGTTYATPTHPGREGWGPEGVRRAVVAARGVPVIAIGGVTVERVTEVVAAGAHGVAVVRGVWGAADPVAALEKYVEALARAAGEQEIH
ncbi:MAG: thiamine phosphate synthase, partial [Gemmatimonadetes bacterium]|nr:thiamine phosphate synthase [Gemmatimonadota bacterium]